MCVVLTVKYVSILHFASFSGQTLQELSSHHQAKYTEAEAEYNKKKNRFPDKIPSECMTRDGVQRIPEQIVPS